MGRQRAAAAQIAEREPHHDRRFVAGPDVDW
jgi:hypothetical protein